jgi:hypothetical protein
MSTKIQVRRGTAAQWTAANPTLDEGEIGFETDTGKIKVGPTPAVAWNSLAYVTDTSDFVGILDGANGGTGVDNTGKTITLGGNLTTSGAHTTTLTTTANTSLTLPTSGTVASSTSKLSMFASTTSAELRGVVSDETGSGSLVFGTSPTFTNTILGGNNFSAFGTTNNLTIGLSSFFLGPGSIFNYVYSGNLLGGTAEDNYSSRSVTGHMAGGAANLYVNLGTGVVDGTTFSAIKYINIGTGTLISGGLTYVNIGTAGATTTFDGTVSLPSTTSIGNVTSTEIGYVDGVTSAIQTQINTKAPTAAPAFTGSGTVNSGRLGAVVGGQGTTTSGSNLTVTHGLGVTPTSVVATVRATTYSSSLNTNIFVGTPGATTFTVFANTGAGAAVAATFSWIAVA